MTDNLPDPADCGCGARLTTAAAWERHIRRDLCTLAGLPRRIVQAAVERRSAS